ncbi:putative protein RSN1 [Cercospora beticola]|uniref:DUF221-domain-containing protein n=1 Tax=Cercospora beticola TaxID=122368 RepID=A0A2G5HJK8_CERBT|nr:putative protein RSN1 [Cercospora beticola]PIA92746.1 putative protein RSN1 [Cercospora beticola]WPB01118.1 hypothetical protein RHO25_005739 [Cercospora beticola]CAK1364136.1 unnamed protein product [Cercospora beticola]
MEALQHAEMHVFRRQNSADNTGSNAGGGSSSLSGLVSTLVPVLLISTAIFVAFLLFRKRYSRVYQPRTFLGSLRNWQRSPQQTDGVLGWRQQYNKLTDEFVLGAASLDNYLWLRFFKMLTLMCLVGCCITMPILFPVNATGGAPGISGLEILSFSNIVPGPRYYAQVFVSWLFLAWVMFLITRESKFFVRLRQRYFLSPNERTRISTRTLLFVNVPEEARNEEHIRSEFAGVKKVWLVNVPEELAQKVEDRDKAAGKLESGEIKMIKNYIKRETKAEKKGKAQTRTDPEQGVRLQVEQKDRPQHRLPKLKVLPLGKKVDTIDWARAELHRSVPEIAAEQNRLRTDTSQPQGACFVEFESVQAAHAALLQSTNVSKKEKVKKQIKMTPKELGPPPQDVIWKNIIKPFWKVKAFNAAGTAFIWFLCIFWTIPVAVIGAISNINNLTEQVPFLSFINDIPPVILGVVTGLLPVLLLSILMLLVPIICNIIAKQFEPTQGSAQMKVQSWYFPFQVIQVFLVTTFSSGAASVAGQIVSEPTSAPALLATNLPRASNFYISYFILFGLMTAAMQFLNVVPLLFAIILGKILDKTPRKMYNRYVNLAGLGWGSLYPKFTNLGVIALAYSGIAPLVLGFATVGFFLLYLAFRYNVLFTLGTNASTRGASYARALQQLTTGIYLSEVCLIGLFAIGIASTNQAIGPLVLMVVFLAATIAWHIWLRRSINKMEAEMPEDSINPSAPAAAGEIGHDDASDIEKVHGSIDATNGQPLAAKNEYENPAHNPVPAAKQDTSLLGPIKAYFLASPDDAARTALAQVSPNLSEPVRPYTPQEHHEAYLHPAIISPCPIIWIARDKYGLSKQEIALTREGQGGEGYEMTDEGAVFNDKGRIEWNQDDAKQAPIWKDEPLY